jgi:hypothetical protein
MKIGYSFWGFLGTGITDTPDGGRSHRRTLIDGLGGLGHGVVFLQPNRDLAEAGDDLTGLYSWDDGFPDSDLLFLEWRWAIPGRTDRPCGTSGHTCDLHRQEDLLRHYTIERSVPTLIWDKDQKLPYDHPLARLPHVRICEPAFRPEPGRTSLLFPVADSALDRADPAQLARLNRDIPLVYIGNQYDRDEAFNTYFAPTAARVSHLVAGKWPRTARWPNVTFAGRIPFRDVEGFHRRALATVLLAPDRYAASGQFTQRTFEAVLQGCLPLGPTHIRCIDAVVPPQLLVRDGYEVADRIAALAKIAGTPHHAHLIADCISRLNPFRLSLQLRCVTEIFEALSHRAMA